MPHGYKTYSDCFCFPLSPAGVGAAAVAAMLEDKTELSTLLLESNGIGPEGAEVAMGLGGGGGIVPRVCEDGWMVARRHGGNDLIRPSTPVSDKGPSLLQELLAGKSSLLT
jgi:hypothetical protein